MSFLRLYSRNRILGRTKASSCHASAIFYPAVRAASYATTIIIIIIAVITVIIGVARIVSGIESVSSVHPSVCPIRQLQQRAAGLLLWARRVGIYRLIAVQPAPRPHGAAARRAAANAGSATFTADIQQMTHGSEWDMEI